MTNRALVNGLIVLTVGFLASSASSFLEHFAILGTASDFAMGLFDGLAAVAYCVAILFAVGAHRSRKKRCVRQVVSMVSYSPGYAHLSDGIKSQITLGHVFSTSSGLPWTQAYAYEDPRNDLNAMVYSDDPIGSVLEKKTVVAPGTEFVYNSSTTNLLGETIRRTSDLTRQTTPLRASRD